MGRRRLAVGEAQDDDDDDGGEERDAGESNGSVPLADSSALACKPAAPVPYNDYNELETETKTAIPGVVDTSGRPTRPKSAYFHFCDAKRAEIMTNLGSESKEVSKVAKLLGAEWKKLTEDARAPFAAKALADKERFKVEMERWQAENAEQGMAESIVAQAQGPITPLKFVRDLMTRDPDTTRLQPLTCRVVAKAVDLFIGALAEECVRRGDKKRVRQIDVHNAVYADDDRFGFLAHDFDTPAELAFKMDRERRKLPKPSAPGADDDAALIGGGQRQITQFFKV